MTDLRLQAPALAGTLALLLAALLAWGLVPRWRADQDSADRALQQRARQAPAAARVAAVLPADQRLAQALPPADAVPQRLAALVHSAGQSGLQLDSVRQAAPLRLGTGAAALPAERVPLRLTGRGPYTAWRRFVAEALQQDDALLLDQLRLGRRSPADNLLEGDLQWLLLQRAGDGASAAAQTPGMAAPVAALSPAPTPAPVPGAAP
jgi:hypothetical protein